MSRRVISVGDSLKDFHRAGGEPWTESMWATTSTLYAPGGLIRYPASQGESLPRASLFSVLGGDLPAPTPHNQIKNSLNSEDFVDS